MKTDQIIRTAYQGREVEARILSIDTDPRCDVLLVLSSNPDISFLAPRSALQAAN